MGSWCFVGFLLGFGGGFLGFEGGFLGFEGGALEWFGLLMWFLSADFWGFCVLMPGVFGW